METRRQYPNIARQAAEGIGVVILGTAAFAVIAIVIAFIVDRIV